MPPFINRKPGVGGRGDVLVPRERLICSLFFCIQVPASLALASLPELVHHNPYNWLFARVVNSIITFLDLLQRAVMQYAFTTTTTYEKWIYSLTSSMFRNTIVNKSWRILADLRASFIWDKEVYMAVIVVYIDGSKTYVGVNALAVFPDLIVSHTLPASSSVFLAELIDMTMAVHRISNCT